MLDHQFDPGLVGRIAAIVAHLRPPHIRGFDFLAPDAEVTGVTMDVAMLRIDGDVFEGTMRITVAMPSTHPDGHPTLSTEFGDFQGVMVDGLPRITVAVCDLDGGEAATPTPEERRGSFRLIHGGR